MGYALMIDSCFVCNRMFAFNPVTVPSFRDSEGVRQPTCKRCMIHGNDLRVKKGLPIFQIRDDAYEPCDEALLY